MIKLIQEHPEIRIQIGKLLGYHVEKVVLEFPDGRIYDADGEVYDTTKPGIYDSYILLDPEGKDVRPYRGTPVFDGDWNDTEYQAWLELPVWDISTDRALELLKECDFDLKYRKSIWYASYDVWGYHDVIPAMAVCYLFLKLKELGII